MESYVECEVCNCQIREGMRYCDIHAYEEFDRHTTALIQEGLQNWREKFQSHLDSKCSNATRFSSGTTDQAEKALLKCEKNLDEKTFVNAYSKIYCKVHCWRDHNYYPDNQGRYHKWYFSKFNKLMLPRISDIAICKHKSWRKKEVSQYFSPLKHALQSVQICVSKDKKQKIGWLHSIVTKISTTFDRVILYRFSMSQSQFLRIVLALGKVKHQHFCDGIITDKIRSHLATPSIDSTKRETNTQEILVIRFTFQGNPKSVTVISIEIKLILVSSSYTKHHADPSI
ncbi:unnamed protein product [Moneuplotes crassus]|uniref:Uncharacterized protein n=1 Tax=Euplotes crassus TaxID=5936 RepID=A0AAD2CZF8_EUPCR|nr:unnamed protein product [Moneuplotes crassus]